ncbi:MAG TPA: iron-containing alcohol dehydrogenase [Vicinamibacterales bacterium]
MTGEGSIDRLGELAKELGFSRTLLVADAGLVRAGHLEHARASLEAAAVDTIEFSEFGPNPDAGMLEAGRNHASGKGIDSIIGLGGGSSLDCAKGINFLLTQGGAIHDFEGYGKALKPMLPMIGVPTTAGTGSEAQSYAIISDPRTHRKMACGDPKAAFRAVILDPRLTLTQPPSVTAAAGYDAIAHAVESFVCTKRNARSQERSLEAWRLLEANYERVLTTPGDLEARAAMQLGAFHAGTAIELSMLGATHACANPVTARYGTTHGNAIAILLPHVVRWNATVVDSMYAELLRTSAPNAPIAPIAPIAPPAPIAPTAPIAPIAPIAPVAPVSDSLAVRLSVLAAAGDLPKTLREAGVSSGDLMALASEAAAQWTGTFNPRPFDANGALEIYRCAF